MTYSELSLSLSLYLFFSPNVSLSGCWRNQQSRNAIGKDKSSQMLVVLVKSLSCLTLCNPKNYTVHGILQARILEWVVFPFSMGSAQPRN